jgi:hypothetical protein
LEREQTKQKDSGQDNLHPAMLPDGLQKQIDLRVDFLRER